MIFKREVTKAPESCICEMQELPNQIKYSNIKSYIISKECEICKSLREKEEQNLKIMKEKHEKEIKIAAEKDRILREEAEKNLKNKGEI